MDSTLRQPVAARLPRRTNAEWDAVVRGREVLDEQRKRLQREADALAREIARIDAELELFLESKTEGQKEHVFALPHFVLSFVWKPASAMAVAFAALRRLAADEKRQLESSLPPSRKLEIQHRDGAKTL